MTAHLLAFADALGLTQVDLLGFSLWGMVTRQVALERPSLVRDDGQAAGQALMTRLAARTEDREPVAGPQVAQAQLAAFRAWGRVDGDRFGTLRPITPPCLVVNGVFDNMIPVRNSYALGEHLPRAIVL
jgi:pimeloyl-ACP methyl ester carboxylesterase